MKISLKQSLKKNKKLKSVLNNRRFKIIANRNFKIENLQPTKKVVDFG